jgi:hypothetical protein
VTDPTTIALNTDRVLHLLAEGETEVEGLIPWSSNATLLVTVRDAAYSTLAVYKPQDGERPLWDFPRGTLGMREVAAYLVSEVLGWDLVPPTVLREGPHGLGSFQFFVHAQEDAHFFTIQDDPNYLEALRRLAAFDIVVNNADRKSGHCLLDQEGHMWAIDNALTFHTDYKLRTVIWDFIDHLLPADMLDDLATLDKALSPKAPLSDALEQLLDSHETEALRLRIRQLIESERFPPPGPGHAVPWPLV